MRFLKHLAGSILVAAGLLTTGCATVQDAAATPQRSSQEVRAELQRLYDLSWGSPRARQAVEVLAYVGFQERVGSCLAADGWSYTSGNFIDATAATRPALSWLDPLLPADEAKAAEMGFGSPGPRGGEITPSRQWPGKDAPASAVMACEAKAGLPESLPAVDPALDGELYRLVTTKVKDIDRALAISYPKCMQSHGHTVREDRRAFVSSIVGERSNAAGALAASERQAAVADARCRVTAHEKAMMALDVPLRELAATNAAKLAELAKRPDQLQAEAKSAALRLGLNVHWL